MSLIVLCGKTASGKTLIRNMLKNKGYRPIVTYTTRPLRRGEVEGKSYHFVTDEEFDAMIADGKFAEYKEYEVCDGEVWRYGSTKESILNTKNGVIILTPQGYRDVKPILPKNTVCIYLYANRNTIIKRLKRRGDDEDEIQRRIASDAIDFAHFQYEENIKVIYNNDTDDVDKVVKRIVAIAV